MLTGSNHLEVLELLDCQDDLLMRAETLGLGSDVILLSYRA